jgi:DNA-binding LacI/PurR family transcriptional regulator
MGKEALKLTIGKIRNNDKKYSTIIVKENLVLRKSCGRKMK